jgi:hypothetical protein
VRGPPRAPGRQAGEPTLPRSAMAAAYDGGDVRLAPAMEEWLPGRDYTIVERLNRPKPGQAKGEGAESVVFQVRKDGRDYALKLIAHVVGTTDTLAQDLATQRWERAGRAGPYPAPTQVDRREGRRLLAYKNSDEGLHAELRSEWREITRLLVAHPHQNLVPVLHYYHSAQPALRARDAHGHYVLDPAFRASMAERTLVMVMNYYRRGSLLSHLRQL